MVSLDVYTLAVVFAYSNATLAAVGAALFGFAGAIAEFTAQ
jgi:hypothetical protein